MAKMLLGQFDDFESAERLVAELQSLGVDGEDIHQFALNAPGQHDQYPIGGDEDADPGARGGENGAKVGAVLGGAAGIAVGVAAMPVWGAAAAVAGLAIGAYTGSFAGALNGMGADPESGGEQVISRPAGVRVAVNVPTPERRYQVQEALVRHSARSIEEAEGTWRNGSWVDFDPVSIPRWVIPPVA